MASRQSGKLGKSEAALDQRTLALANYLTPSALPPLAQAVDHTPANVQAWPDFGNFNFSDCVEAAVANAILYMTGVVGQAVTLSLSDVLAWYARLTRFNPSTGAGDYGTVLLDAMNAWRTTGLSGHSIVAYLSVDPRNRVHLQYGVQLFGGVLAGAALPQRARSQFAAGQPWMAPSVLWGIDRPGGWGGHAFWVPKFDQRMAYARTWTHEQPLSYHWWESYADEAYIPLSKDWLNAQGKSPDGFDLDQLLSDLNYV